MKRFSFLMAALLVAMTGCQKEPQVTENGSDAQTVGYVSLKISLPKDAATKAEANDANNPIYNGGLEEEYNVEDITVVFFDADGKFVYKTSVSEEIMQKQANGGAVSATGKTDAIEVKTSESTLYALVLINSVNSHPYDDAITCFEDYNYVINEANAKMFTGSDRNYFYMSNAPYYEAGEFKTLVPVNVQTTQEAAKGSPAHVNVERAVSKVSVRYEHSLHVQEPTNDLGDIARVAGWNLDIKNTVLYPVRNCYDNHGVNNDWYWNNALLSSIWDGKRVHMAIDPNYDRVFSDDENELSYQAWQVTFERAIDDDLTLVDMESSVAYCLENTFNINCMRKNQTTSVVLKVQYTPVVEDDDIVAKGETWFMVGESQRRMSQYKLADVLNQKVIEYCQKHNLTPIDEILNYYEDCDDFIAGNNGERIEVIVSLDNNAYHTVKLSELLGEVVCYKNGFCYYSIPIRHFNDEELGYDSSDEFFESFGQEIVGYKPQHLGRYGVVRNNWYSVTINSISNPGSPVIPTPGNTPDDETKQYVSCDINILAWRLRGQIVDL